MNVKTGTLSDAIEAVTTMEIVLYFNIEYKVENGRVYLICPGHDDHSFGSCYIDKNDNGYYCYACGEHVNKWNMVLKLLKGNKSEAAKWFFEQSGMTPQKEPINDAYQKTLTLIKRLEKYVNNEDVFNDLYPCEKTEASYGRNINSQYLYSEKEIQNPLLDLYKLNKDSFKAVAMQALQSAMNKLHKVEKYCNQDRCIYTEDCGLIGYEQFQKTCKSEMDAIQELGKEIRKL